MDWSVKRVNACWINWPCGHTQRGQCAADGYFNEQSNLTFHEYELLQEVSKNSVIRAINEARH